MWSSMWLLFQSAESSSTSYLSAFCTPIYSWVLPHSRYVMPSFFCYRRIMTRHIGVTKTYTISVNFLLSKWEKGIGTMTTRGYNEIRKKYYHITNLWHDTKCMKNRVKNCKTMYQFWLKLNQNTGLGQKPDGTIDASPEWWTNNTKVLTALVSPRPCALLAVMWSNHLCSPSVHFRDKQSARNFSRAILLTCTF